MSERSGPRLTLWVIRVASRLVPRSARDEWRREWEAEVRWRWDELEARSALTLAARADLLLRALGSVIDGVTYRHGRWTMSGWVHDVRIAARGLVRQPLFSAVVILTLAVGIGANTAIFGVARDVLLRPFPYPDPDRVVAIESVALREGGSGSVTYPNIADLDAAATTFDAIGATRWWIPALEDDRGSIVVRGATVTANFFSILGVEAGMGRYFRPDEQGEGRTNQVVLSHGLWIDYYGADPAVVGSEIRLSGVAYEVIGVTGPDFEDPWLMDGPGAEPQMWRTVASPPSEWPRSGRSWRGIGRVRSDVSVEVAQAEVAGIFAGLAETYPEENAERTIRITPLRDVIAAPAMPVLVTLMASVGLLLLVACTNLANLMLGRALDRRGEMALHRALGATGWRIVHRSLAEAGILAGVGGLLGLALAVGLSGLATSLEPMLPRPVSGGVDGAVLAFAGVLTIGTAALFGLLPALQSARAEDALPGRDASRGNTRGRPANRLRRSLVVAELALTTVLLVGAGLLVRSFQQLDAVELGFVTEGVVGMELHSAAWGGLDPAMAQAQWDAVLDAVRSDPSVTAAGAIDYLPLSGSYSCDGIQRTDQPPPEPGRGRCAEVRVVLPGAVEAMGIPLVRGRLINGDDRADAPAVAVIDESMAEAFWSGEDPLGATFTVHGSTHEVVGIVRDMRHFGPGGTHRPMVYLHAPQEGWNGITRGLALLARGEDATTLVAPVRDAVARVNGSIAIGEVETFDRLLRDTMAAPRFRTLLMGAFGVTALLLAIIGVTGVMGYSVARRTKEIGVRLALGANPVEVRRLVLREGVRLVILGVGLGLVGAAVIAGALDTLLFDVGARDPLIYGAVAFLLVGTATLACFLPARRASRVDPVAALGAE